MRSSNKKPEANRRQVREISGGDKATSSQDGDSAQLKRLSKALGNQGLGSALSEGNQQRDRLLAHIIQRLSVIQGAQGKERAAMSREREWFKEVAKGTEGYHLPDPTRWHESARLYKKAADALCSGQLGRGAQLIEQAAEAEDAAFRSVPKMVKSDLEAEEKAAPCPDDAFAINDEAGCAGCSKPQGLEIANRILDVRDKMEPTPPMPRQKQWWEEGVEEEEEEEEDDD